MKRSMMLAAAAAAATLTLTTPAAAAPAVLVEHWTEHDEFLAHERFDTPQQEWCPEVDFDVLVVEDASGTFRLVQHGDSLFHGANTFRREGSFTNLDNGQTFSFVTSGQDKDVHVTDLGGGLVSIDTQTTGRTLYRGPDGKKLFIDAGRFSATVVIDTKGTLTDEDDVEVSFEFHGTTGRWETTGRNFCDDLIEFIG